MSNEKSNKVGYKSPPKKHQWKKGQSGNPTGKKKNKSTGPVQPLLEQLAGQLSNPLEITTGGKKQKVTLGEAFTMKMLHDAMNAPLKERLRLLTELQKLGVLDLQKSMAEQAVQDHDPFSEEDRRILAAILKDTEDDCEA